LGLRRSPLTDRTAHLVEEVRQPLEEGAVLTGNAGNLDERTKVEPGTLRLRQLLAQRLQLLNLLLQLLELLLVRLLVRLDGLCRLTLLCLLSGLRLLSLRVLSLLTLWRLLTLLALGRLWRLFGLSHEKYLTLVTR
jgi:hypothetical protein